MFVPANPVALEKLLRDTKHGKVRLFRKWQAAVTATSKLCAYPSHPLLHAAASGDASGGGLGRLAVDVELNEPMDNRKPLSLVRFTVP
jgi:hypothetical protein